MRSASTMPIGFAAFVVLLFAAFPCLAQQGLGQQGPGQQDDAVLLRLRLEPGQSYRASMTTETETSQTAMGQAMEMKGTVGIVMSFDVLPSEEDGAMTVRVAYESVKVSQDGPMGQLTYDSSDLDAVAPPALHAYSFILDEVFTMHVNAEGAVDRVEMPENLIARMLEGMDLPGAAMPDDLVEGLEQQFGGEAMSDLIRGAFQLFPHDPVEVGGSWSRSDDLKAPVPMAMETTWTLRERRDGVAYIDVQSESISDGTMDMGGMVMTYDMSGSGGGTLEVDEATGMTLRSRLEQVSSGTMTVGGSAMGDMTIPMSTRSVTVTEILSGN